MKEVMEDHQTGSTATTSASLSGRVRDGAAKQLLAKQLQGLHGNLPEFMNLTTGQIRSKKAKKEKTPAQEAMAEMKKMHKKLKQIVNELPKCIQDIEDYGVRNCSELVAALDGHREPALEEFGVVNTLINTPLSDVDPQDFNVKLEASKTKAAVILGDLNDGKRRVNAAKGPKKKKQVQSRAEESSIAEDSD